MRKTLPEQIAANRRASVLYASILVFLLTALGTAIVGTFAPKMWPIGLGGSLVLALGAAIFALNSGSSVILSVSGVREATPEEDQVLNNVVEEMAIASGLPKPRVVVIDDTAPNAFATGKDPQHATVAVTTGLLEKLDRDELQGVVAHEMAHIRNYDVRLMTTLAVVAGLIPLMADFFLRMLWHGGGSRKRDKDEGNLGMIFLVVGLVLAILAPIFAKLLELAVSRQREYMADATAAEMTRYPEGLARALQKIAMDPEPLEAANRATQHMYIINPLKAHAGASLFSTHPPTEDRIQRLMGIMGSTSQRLPEGDFAGMPEIPDQRRRR